MGNKKDFGNLFFYFILACAWVIVVTRAACFP